MKSFLQVLSFVLMIAILPCCSPASGTLNGTGQYDKEGNRQAVAKSVSEKEYTIRVNTAMGQRGRMINLSTTYDLVITKTAIKVDLPYFGQAFSNAGYGSGGGVNFTSTNFDYAESPGKKKGWDITIKPKDDRDVQQMFIAITQDGYANISINFNSRTAMRYSGMMVFHNTSK